MLFQASVILGAVTIFAIISYVITPEEKWLPHETIVKALQAADGGPES